MKIKKVPQVLVRLKILPSTICIALSPYIFLSNDLYEDYLTSKASFRTIAIIAHESVHIERQQKIGLLKFLFLYFFSKTFCLNEEIEAIRAEMKVYKLHAKQFDFKRRSLILSTFWMYHHCIAYKDALEKLHSLWDEI
jgi:hypothetical protein